MSLFSTSGPRRPIFSPPLSWFASSKMLLPSSILLPTRFRPLPIEAQTHFNARCPGRVLNHVPKSNSTDSFFHKPSLPRLQDQHPPPPPLFSRYCSLVVTCGQIFFWTPGSFLSHGFMSLLLIIPSPLFVSNIMPTLVQICLFFRATNNPYRYFLSCSIRAIRNSSRRLLQIAASLSRWRAPKILNSFPSFSFRQPPCGPSLLYKTSRSSYWRSSPTTT